jgi:hypothetical protein
MVTGTTFHASIFMVHDVVPHLLHIDKVPKSNSSRNAHHHNHMRLAFHDITGHTSKRTDYGSDEP